MAPARRVREGLIAFLGASAVLFTAGAAATIVSQASMPMTCGGTLPGWSPTPGQGWGGAAASFDAMWVAMMLPMMVPSLAPPVWRYGQSVARDGKVHWAVPAAAAAAGYFFVWALLGVAVYPLAVLLAATGTPLVAAAIVLAAGLVQLGAWKQRQLARCRELAHGRGPGPSTALAPSGWLHGMHLGVCCALSCGNLMAVVLAAGLMDLPTMAAITAAVTLERTVPARVRAAPAIGMVVVGAGLVLLARAGP